MYQEVMPSGNGGGSSMNIKCGFELLTLSNNNNFTKKIMFDTPMSNADYVVCASLDTGTSGYTDIFTNAEFMVHTKSTDGFMIRISRSTAMTGKVGCDWIAIPR